MGLAGRPHVSVVMPARDSAAYVDDAVAGVQEQSFDDWELIVIDDGSTDATRNLVEARQRDDARIRVLPLDRQCGPAFARNQGIRSAKGRYIAFCDSDDHWRPEKLTRQLDAIERRWYAVCCTAYAKMDESGETTGRVIKPPSRITDHTLLRSNPIGLSTAMIDTEVCGKVYMPDIARRQDYGLWLRIMREGHVALGLDEPLVDYRVRKGSLSSNKALTAWYTWRVLREVAELSIPRASIAFMSYLREGLRKARI